MKFLPAQKYVEECPSGLCLGVLGDYLTYFCVSLTGNLTRFLFDPLSFKRAFTYVCAR